MRRPRAGLRSRLRFGAVALFAVVAVATANVAAADSTSGGYSAYIVNGSSTTIAKWPFLVELLHHGTTNTYDAHFCDGSLVAPTIVLNPAPCTYSDPERQHKLPAAEVDVLGRA